MASDCISKYRACTAPSARLGALQQNLTFDVLFGRQQSRIITHHNTCRRVRSAPSMVGKLKVDGRLTGHRGCVNTVAFSEHGDFCVTGSDDTYLMLWDVAAHECRMKHLSGHQGNIFCARFLPHTNNTEVVSVAADGQVRWNSLARPSSLLHCPWIVLTLPLSGISKQLARHNGRAHRLAVTETTSFLTCGEDGRVLGFDTRDAHKRHLLTVTTPEDDVIPLYALSCSPVDGHSFVVGGTSVYMHHYDARHVREPVGRYAPFHLRDDKDGASKARKLVSDHITGTAFNWNGREVLATYNDECVYLFRVECDAARGGAEGEGEQVPWESSQDGLASDHGEERAEHRRPSHMGPREAEEDGQEDASPRAGDSPALHPCSAAYSNPQKRMRQQTSTRQTMRGDVVEEKLRGYTQVFRGHRNDHTVKQVNFFGARSEYVVSGCDTGHIFMWETQSGELAQLLYGDRRGAVNCLETHPNLPVLATSGLEHDVKIWRPTRGLSVRKGALKAHGGETAEKLAERNAKERKKAARISNFTRFMMGRALSSVSGERAGSGSEEEDSENGLEGEEISGDGQSSRQAWMMDYARFLVGGDESSEDEDESGLEGVLEDSSDVSSSESSHENDQSESGMRSGVDAEDGDTDDG